MKVLGLTIGDPAGIGPGISVLAAASADVRACCRPLIIGDARAVRRALRHAGVDAGLDVVAEAGAAAWDGRIAVLDVPALGDEDVAMGRVQARAGAAAFAYIRAAVELAKQGAIAGIVTAPINKEAIRAAGVPHIGHTEMLAALTGASGEMTMFAVENLRIFFLTRHVPLAEACRLAADPEYVYRGIARSCRALRDLGLHRPRLAVAALNPHAGEGGLLGREEDAALRPAVERARREGWDVSGPVPADSVFHKARQGLYDAVLSLYHDQGHIAAKAIDFEKTVSVTLGLPILRTSVDHGTAYDIAGRGAASPVSMIEAVKVAVELAPAGRTVGGAQAAR